MSEIDAILGPADGSGHRAISAPAPGWFRPSIRIGDVVRAAYVDVIQRMVRFHGLAWTIAIGARGIGARPPSAAGRCGRSACAEWRGGPEARRRLIDRIVA